MNKQQTSIRVWLVEQDDKRVRQVAEDRGLSLSTIGKQAIREWLDREEETQSRREIDEVAA